MEDLERVDLVVIGAGIHGLAAAKTYLQVTPSAKIVIFEAATAIGGTWAKNRLYPELKSNNVLGMYEYSDFPMDTETYGVKPEEHIPGTVLHRYLKNYAENFGFYKNIRFNSKVESAEHVEGGGWTITAHSSDTSGNKSQLYASKLIVATGMTSNPLIPVIAGSESFGVPLFHSKELLKHPASTLDIKGTESVSVIGCNKSGWDAVYAYASKGVTVDWIVRESGHGPVWMSPPKVTPLKRFLEKLVLTRVLTWFSPCIWGSADGYPGIRYFLHKTAIGRFIVRQFWVILGGDVVALNGFDRNPAISSLKPWTNPMFIGAGLSILNYDTNFFDLVSNGTVRVHVADIKRLDSRVIYLTNGSTISTAALVLSTGWKHAPPLKFLPSADDFGVPGQSEYWESGEPSDRVDRVDEEIFAQLPLLRSQPSPNPKLKPLLESADIRDNRVLESKSESFKLYRFIVPPKFIKSHDLAFAGCIMSISTSICSEVQALWITAHLLGEVPIQADPQHETALHNRFAKWRTPVGFGARFPDFAFDSLPYYDLLLRDLGLNHRRKVGMVANIFHSHEPQDYTGLVDEWLGKKTSLRTS